MDFFFEGRWRMDWGLGNPNKTAVLIAQLILASWGLVYWKRWGFWLSLLLTMALELCLILTYSRGGVLALICGLSTLLMFVQRPWPKTRTIAILISVVIISFLAYYSKAFLRYGKGLKEEDLSITHRLEIWGTAPRMMVDAPSGWGWGKSGNAYMQWYQPLGQLEHYRTLVNSHITWLTEMGWLGRMLYIFGWGMVFVLCWPRKDRQWFSITLGIWLTFAIGSLFSSVAESIWLWIIPIFSIIPILVIRVRHQVYPPYAAYIGVISISALILLGILTVGFLTPSILKVYGGYREVYVERPIPTLHNYHLWIFMPDERIIGDHYGHEIRKALMGADPFYDKVGVITSIEDSKPTGGTLVLMGDHFWTHLPNQNLQWNSYSEIILLNPKGTPDKFRVPERAKLNIVWGEFRQHENKKQWQLLVRKNIRFVEATGMAEYIVNWIQQVTEYGLIRPSKHM